MDQLFIDIYRFGTCYNPASDHYEGNNEVYCDRCNKDIDISIGYLESDLCINCAHDVGEFLKNQNKQSEEKKPSHVPLKKGMKRKIYR
jgi:hypothetical protein